MAIALPIGFCFAWGFLLLGAIWPPRQVSSSEHGFRLFLTLGFGIGLFSVVFFVTRLAGITHLLAADSFVTLVLATVYAWRRNRITHPLLIESRSQDFNLPVWLRHALTASFVLSTLVACGSALLQTRAHPHGYGWDAFSIWNLHARFLFLGGDHWREGFSALIPWSHPDYPLLTPAAIAHFWSYLGHDDPRVPAALSITFACATLGLLVSSLMHLRERHAAMLAGIALASTPFFVEQATAQYADIPLAFFCLASMVCLHLGLRNSGENSAHHPTNWSILAGVALGFAAWTKNEGQLFVAAFLLAQVASALSAGRRPSSCDSAQKNRLPIAALLIALAPMLLLIGWFKHTIAPPGDLFSSGSAMLQKIASPGRYWIILRWYGKEFFRFGNWWIVPGTVLLVVLYLALRSGTRRHDPALRSSILTLALTLAGYFAIYVITPYDIYWHLRFSLNRLFLQLWPSTIFLFFLFVGGQSRSLSPDKSI